MNGHDHHTTRGVAGADPDPPSPLEGRVGAMTGRRVRDLRVEVRGGGLVLRGRADSYYAKQLAQHAAMAATNMPLVANRIEVSYVRPGVCRPGAEDDMRGRAGAPPRVLLATGDGGLRSDGRALLAAHGYVVTTVSGGAGCGALLRQFTPDVAVLDADLFGGADGVPADLCAGSDVRVPVVLLTSPVAARPGGHGEAAPSPVVLLLEKPVGADALLRAMRSATGVGPVTAPRG